MILYQCHYGYLISKPQYELSRRSFLCPKCEKYHFGDFKQIKK